MIYENVVKAARERDIPITALEEKAGIGNGTIGKWKNSSPNLDTLEKVANALGVPVISLISAEP